MREHERSGTDVVDGLRGFAVLWVLCYHTWLFSWYTPAAKVFGVDLPVDVLPRVGYLGVDLFFVISGFCLFAPYASEAVARRYSAPGAGFALRRAAKIVPSYALALAATALVALANGQVRPDPGLARSLVAHATFLNNFYIDPFGYTNSVFWSLAVEVQFYLAFPLAARSFAHRPFATALGFFALAAGYRIVFAGCCLQDEVVMRQLPAYLDLFAAGMGAAYLVAAARRADARRAPHPAVWTFAFAAAALFVWRVATGASDVTYVPDGRERFDIYGRTMLALGFGGLIVAGCNAARPLHRLVANPPLRFLSVVSYNLYLWHTLVMIWLWKHDVPRAATSDPHADDRWKGPYIALGWSVSLAIATGVTYFIERPLLATIKPQRFAFDWRRVARSASARRTRRIVSRGTRT